MQLWDKHTQILMYYSSLITLARFRGRIRIRMEVEREEEREGGGGGGGEGKGKESASNQTPSGKRLFHPMSALVTNQFVHQPKSPSPIFEINQFVHQAKSPFTKFCNKSICPSSQISFSNPWRQINFSIKPSLHLQTLVTTQLVHQAKSPLPLSPVNRQ